MDFTWLLAAGYNVTAGEIGLPTSTSNVGQILGNITQLLMGIMGGLALVFLVYGALQFAYSRGNAKNVQTARETIIYACVGLIFAIGGYAVVTFLLSYVK